MNCNIVKDLLYDYTKNEITPEQKSKIESHLKECASCAGSLKELNFLKSLFKSDLKEPSPAALRAVRSHFRPHFGWLFGLKPAIAFAATILLVAGVMLTGGIKDAKNSQLTEFMNDSYSIVDNSDSYINEPVFLEEEIGQEIF